jgi:dTDP-4-amino-4,6-dideoxygalactose transaminase
MTEELIKVASPQVGEEEIAAVRDVLLSGWYVSGPKVKKFERRFADYVGVEHAVMVNSGTAAIHAALMAIGVGPGDEVIVPALTFFSTATAVIHQNAVPVFADISLDNFCMAPEDFERRITPRTKAVIPVHYFGHAAEMDAINEIAERHDIMVIEDCAQAHGTVYKGQRVGSIGHLGAFSFFATKHMTTGEGGAVTTDNAEWAEKMRIFRSHGLKGRNDHVLLGYNYRMTEMEAAMGMVQLEKLERLNAARIRKSEYLIERLGDIPWLTLPKVPPHVKHTYFWLHILVDEDALGFDTQELIDRLRERGVEVRHRYLEPLNRQPMLTDNLPEVLRLAAGDDLPNYGEMHLVNAERAAGQVIGLPNRPDMTQAELDRVAGVLHKINP